VNAPGYVPGLETWEMRWEALRRVIDGLADCSARMAAEFPASDEAARADTFRRVGQMMTDLEDHFPLVSR